MPRKSRETILQEVHGLAVERMNRIQSAQRDERIQCLDDRRFYSIAGAMWEGPLYNQWANKPRLEVNKVLMAVISVINEYRNNRFTVEFINKDGTPNSPLADVCNGLFRADEQDSCAQEAYDNAFEEAVGGGIGAFRLRVDYEDPDEGDDLRIRIEPIVDADSSVYFDLNSKRQDKADAEYAFVLYSMTPEAFEAEWGYDPASVQMLVRRTEFDWCTPNLVYVAEYYQVERVNETIVTFEHLDGSEEEIPLSQLDDPEEGDDIREDLALRGARETGREKVRTKRVRKYIMSGDRILEDCGYVPGKCIPIIPVYGKRWFVDGIERCMGLVRPAKDSQRILNMQVSAAAELAAMSAREKPILTPEQAAGHEVMWARDNLDNNAFLYINPVTGSDGSIQHTGPVGYTKVPQLPPAMVALMQLTDASMREMLGVAPEAEKMVSNISGKAVEQIQERLDGKAFIFMDNFAKALRRCGEVWKSMAAEVYVEAGRRMKSIDRMGQTSSVELRRKVQGPGGVAVLENDLSDARLFDVAVSIGPSSRSRKQATHRSIMEMMAITQDPATLQVLQALAFVNMDGEGLSDVQAFFRRKLVEQGVMPPTDEEMAEMQAAAANAQPDPQQQALLAYAEGEKAKAAKARADTVLTIANAQKVSAETERTQAETAQILTDTGLEPDRLMLDVARTMQRAAPPPA